MVDRERIRMAGWALAAAVAVGLAVRLLGSGADGREPRPGAAGPPPAAAMRPPGAGPELLVQVAGEVERPGVYRVAAGARVNDAGAHAGGVPRRAAPAGVNLVARLQDGQQVVVPRRGAAAVAATGAGAAGAAGASGAAARAGPGGPSSATHAPPRTPP